MDYEWDDDKDASNLRKHGIPFEYATAVFEDKARLERADFDAAYDEDRWIVIGLVEDQELTVVATERGKTIRRISARKATIHERREYWENREAYP